MPSGVYVRSQEYCGSVRQQRLGTKASPESRAKQSESNLLRYKSDPTIRIRISKALSGVPKSPEHVEKVRLANLGKVVSNETREHLRLSHLGHTPTEETRKRLSESLRLAHAEGKMPGFGELARKKCGELAAARVGPLHPRWVVDRTKLARLSQRRNTADRTWSSHVRRVFPKCVLSNSSYGECAGRLESHHVETIKQCPEKRYDDGNGVTLCRRHHPRKETEASAMVEMFKNILAGAERTF